ncbi:MAG: hypothetical protein K9M07_03850 [Simkaniaceae bacterium]|nr:hypothetical protein [Simkaniaceae bacterium]MCF7852360.1 hypothetical protein [Simkaniaceae bacterium]
MDDIKKEFISLTAHFKGWLEDNRPELYFEVPIAPMTSPPLKVLPNEPSFPLRETPLPSAPVPPQLVKRDFLHRKKVVIEKKAPTSKPQEVKKQSRTIELSPIQLEEEDPLADVARSFQQACPHILIHDAIPSDRKAKIVKNAWKIKRQLIDVPIFVSKELHPFLPFFHNLAKAIDIAFAPSKVIEIETFEQKNLWGELLDHKHIRLILCPDLVLWASPYLVTHYKRFPVKNAHRLNDIDLLLLSDPALYLKDPLLKRSLWNMLRQKLVQN